MARVDVVLVVVDSFPFSVRVVFVRRRRRWKARGPLAQSPPDARQDGSAEHWEDTRKQVNVLIATTGNVVGVVAPSRLCGVGEPVMESSAAASGDQQTNGSDGWLAGWLAG